jgi:PPM family protein phosphatase
MDHPRSVSTATGLKWFGWTDRGKIRPNNEDAFISLRFDARDVHHLGKFGEASATNADFAFAVSDGMGGAKAGEFASRIAVDKIARMLPRSFQQSAVGLNVGAGDVLTELFGEVHRALVYLGDSYEECAGMEATLTLCWFTPGWMHFGHIGDSRIYYLPKREGGIKQLSHDDTHVGWLLRTGRIKEWEARMHPRRKVLQRALGGSNQFVEPQIGAVAYESGDIFLLCTDGLVEGLHDHHVVELLRSSERSKPDANVAHQLVLESLEKGCRDNTTALVIEVL